ncbi:methyltransferase [Pycnococcus provasolii]
MSLPSYEGQRYQYRVAQDGRRLGQLRTEFRHIKLCKFALQKILDEYDFESVVDVGSGAGDHAELFIRHGKKYTGIEFGSVTVERRQRDFQFRRGRTASKLIAQAKALVGDFNTMNLTALEGTFDVVWISHVLEHQLDAHTFLRRAISLGKEGGLIVISVPIFKSQMVGGHVSIWTAGHLLYHLVHAGIDCTNARIGTEGMATTVLVPKKSIKRNIRWEYIGGDINRASPYLPRVDGKRLQEGFHGEISYLDW